MLGDKKVSRCRSTVRCTGSLPAIVIRTKPYESGIEKRSSHVFTSELMNTRLLWHQNLPPALFVSASIILRELQWKVPKLCGSASLLLRSCPQISWVENEKGASLLSR